MTYKEAMEIARKEDSDARYFRAVDAILAASYNRKAAYSRAIKAEAIATRNS